MAESSLQMLARVKTLICSMKKIQKSSQTALFFAEKYAQGRVCSDYSRPLPAGGGQSPVQGFSCFFITIC